MPTNGRIYCAPRRISYPLRALDFFADQYADFVYKRRNLGPVNLDAPKILMLSAGHLGDALLLTYTFPLIKQRFPDASIDVVVGDWCKPILETNTFIRRLIYLNHAGANRRTKSHVEKWRSHIASTRKAVKLLKEEVYDYSIDIRFSDSPMHFLLPFIRVRHSIGFGTRGLGGLLQTEMFLPTGEFHHFDMVLALLRPLGINATIRDVEPYYPIRLEPTGSLLKKFGLSAQQPFALLFPEAGTTIKSLPEGFWVQLVNRLLTDTQLTLVGCGQTAFIAQVFGQVLKQFPNHRSRLIDLSAKATIDDLARLSQSATIAFTLDSLPAHLSSIFCPTVSFFNNSVGFQFFPIGNFPTFVLHNHPASRQLVLDRPAFKSQYVDHFDASTIESALAYANEVIQNTAGQRD